MARCAGFKLDGSACERIVRGSQTYCYAHDVRFADKRKRDATKAGRSRQSSEVRDVKAQLQRLVDGLLADEVDRPTAAVCGQLLNVKLRALSLERDIRETEMLEERISELEERARQQWPA